MTVMLDEFKELGAEIRLRIDLQHRNMNVFLILMTALTGFVVKYVSEHGLAALDRSELSVLIALAPFVASVFLWRHLDHDVNIIDKASYIHRVLRPKLDSELGGVNVLEFERHLHMRRQTRARRLGPFLDLGKEDLPMFLILGIYLLAGWYVRLHSASHAGSAHSVFDGFLYAGSFLSVISVVMAINVGLEYRVVGGDEPVKGG